MTCRRWMLCLTGLVAGAVFIGCTKREEDAWQREGSQSKQFNGDGAVDGDRANGASYAPHTRPTATGGAFRSSDNAHNTERYAHIEENDFRRAQRYPLSTFSVDVDTASYSNVRRFLRQKRLPPKGAARIEEMINYFRYTYPQPEPDVPFSITVDAAQCPWENRHQLVRIGLKGKELFGSQRPRCNLVFLLDVSGSMNTPNKLPLVKSALRMLIERLTPDDHVAVAVYAGAAGLVLPSTPVEQRREILNALDRLQAGGSTNGGEGIRLAYRVAEQNFIEDGVNRVILCTDGDFNVGTTSNDALVRLATEKAKTGVTLSVFGFGTGNLNDSMLNRISNKANGNYGYIDSLSEARKAFIEQAEGTLMTIAKDVKIQVDFNPAYVKEYRLLGYEDRMLKDEDFRDDSKDAGDIGAGHTVTALYEIVPPEAPGRAAGVEPSKYQKDNKKPADGLKNGEMLTVRLRYKPPKGSTSKELRVPLKHGQPVSFSAATDDFRFAASVAAFGMLLRDSQYKGTADYDFILKTAESSRGRDEFGYRKEFVELVRTAQKLYAGRNPALSPREE